MGAANRHNQQKNKKVSKNPLSETCGISEGLEVTCTRRRLLSYWDYCRGDGLHMFFSRPGPVSINSSQGITQEDDQV